MVALPERNGWPQLLWGLSSIHLERMKPSGGLPRIRGVDGSVRFWRISRLWRC